MKEKENNRPKAEIQGSFYKLHRGIFKGRALAWKFVKELRCIAVKWEKGILYFDKFHHLKTLPYWAIRDICRHRLTGASNSQISYFAEKMTRESRTKWDLFEPQYPKRIVHKKDIDQITGMPKVTLKYKPPRVLKKIPLLPIPQHFAKDFIWWYYDWKIAEAVIVLKDGEKNFKKIHIFDPMWLINCSHEDIIMLFYNPIYSEVKDAEQAGKYQRVVFLCFAYDINAGCDYDKKLGKFVEKQKVPEVKKTKPKQFQEPVLTKEQKIQRHIRLMNIRMDEQRRQQSKQ